MSSAMEGAASSAPGGGGGVRRQHGDEAVPSRVLVTGASGFLGAHLCDRLLSRGAEVHGVSRIDRTAATTGMRWLRSDFDSEAEVERVLRTVRPDVIYHLAGRVTAAPDVLHVLPTFSSLLASTVHVLLRATELGCRRIVLAGSFTEPTDAAGVPGSPYAAAKWCASVYARMFRALYETPVVVARTFMTYGPRQHESKVIAYVISSLLSGRAPRLSSGALIADWIYVDDVIDGLLAAATAPAAVGEEIDLGTGRLASVREVVDAIVDIVQPAVRPQFGVLPDRPRETARAADVARSETALGWRATTPLHTGLARTIAWQRRQLVDAGRGSSPRR